MTDATEGQRAIVKADAMPETCAAAIERDRGHENRVEKARAQDSWPCGSCMPSAWSLPLSLNLTKRMVRARREVIRGR